MLQDFTSITHNKVSVKLTDARWWRLWDKSRWASVYF
jgi:hypothetical protein